MKQKKKTKNKNIFTRGTVGGSKKSAMRMARRAHCDPEVVDGVGTEKIAPPLAEIS
jgi:hypothetical protein